MKIMRADWDDLSGRIKEVNVEVSAHTFLVFPVTVISHKSNYVKCRDGYIICLWIWEMVT